MIPPVHLCPKNNVFYAVFRRVHGRRSVIILVPIKLLIPLKDEETEIVPQEASVGFLLFVPINLGHCVKPNRIKRVGHLDLPKSRTRIPEGTNILCTLASSH